MNINRKNVNKKLLLAAFSLSVLLTGCRSVEEGKSTGELRAEEEGSYVSRPKVVIESPVSNIPYSLKWEGNAAARSYEVQSAVDLQFTEKRLSWTTRNNSFLLENLPDGESYIRIRSHFNGESSRWSEVLKIERKGDALILEKLRS